MLIHVTISASEFNDESLFCRFDMNIRKQMIIFRTILVVFIGLFLGACGSSSGSNPSTSSADNTDSSSNDTSSSTPFDSSLSSSPNSNLKQGAPIYNQAYAENVEADNINDIIRHAKNAYVLLDPFLSGIAEKIPTIQQNNNEVGCYISIGTGEDWRDDFDDLKPYLVSKQWGEWDGEYFVKRTNTGILSLMKKRIAKLKDFGCDWVEFDNMDWFTDADYVRDYGIEVSESEGITYYKRLCTYTRKKDMMCMAKNTVVGASKFKGVLYESYHNEKDWWEHDGAQAFLDAGKLVIINHYNESYPDNVYRQYIDLYNDKISFISESTTEKKYIHYNQ